MSLTSKTCLIYDWFDIQKEICSIMNIEQQYFRNYHKIIGGDYKDLWHVALDTIIPDQMANDTIVSLYQIEDQIDDDTFWLKGRVWARPFFEAFRELMNDIDPKQEGILVRFSW